MCASSGKMADKNQLKIADQVDLADDDPFAELTRIMGFDPRQPAKQAAAQQNQASAPEPAAIEQASEEDDFSLDLEKELLGEFTLEDETSAPDLVAEAAAPAEAPTPDAQPYEISGSAIPEVDFDFAADFDAAMAASSQDDALSEAPGEALGEALGEAPGEALAGQDAEFDLGLTEDDVRALDAEGSEAAAPALAEEEDFDLGLTEDDIRALEAKGSE